MQTCLRRDPNKKPRRVRGESLSSSYLPPLALHLTQGGTSHSLTRTTLPSPSHHCIHHHFVNQPPPLVSLLPSSLSCSLLTINTLSATQHGNPDSKNTKPSCSTHQQPRSSKTTSSGQAGTTPTSRRHPSLLSRALDQSLGYDYSFSYGSRGRCYSYRRTFQRRLPS